MTNQQIIDLCNERKWVISWAHTADDGEFCYKAKLTVGEFVLDRTTTELEAHLSKVDICNLVWNEMVEEMQKTLSNG